MTNLNSIFKVGNPVTGAVLLFLVFLLTGSVGYARTVEKEKIIVWEHLWSQIHKIEVILDYTVDDFGPYELVKSPRMEQGRAILELEKNKDINLIWLPCSLEREKRLLPIYVYMGGRAMGHRVCLIKKGNQHLFDNIESLQDFIDSGLVLGSGTHWADTEILKYNRIPVATNPVYGLLYSQLELGRFDAFPRGIDQVERNLRENGPEGSGKNISIESRLLFVYPFKEIIFVSKKNPALKRRLEAGYERAVKAGRCSEIFAAKDGSLDMFESLNLKDRVIIHLENPFLSEQALAVPMYGHDPLDR